mmetsp:Transcript_40983/g.66631  ORF Transcript_40983/g.66631 Transcript_40983/m.66631 type:complete len:204 (+) Transcript_40983:89-700(+)
MSSTKDAKTNQASPSSFSNRRISAFAGSKHIGFDEDERERKQESATEFFFAKHKVVRLEPWTMDQIWHKLVKQDDKGHSHFKLDKIIDVVMGGVLRFLANPKIGSQEYGEKKILKMKDLALYCRKLPPVLRSDVIKRLEERLNEEGFSMRNCGGADFNAKYLSHLFMPMITESSHLFKQKKLHKKGSETWGQMPTIFSASQHF